MRDSINDSVYVIIQNRTQLNAKQMDITLYEKASNRLVATANEMVINSEDTNKAATDQLSEIKKAQKLIEIEKQKVLGPLNEAVKAERDRWRPIENFASEAESIIKTKMLGWYNVVRKKAEEERQRIENDARIKKAATIEKKMEEVKVEQQKAAPVVVKTESGGGSQIKKIQVFKIHDEKLIPREFLTPDVQKIKQAIKDGRAVPGAGYVTEETIAAY